MKVITEAILRDELRASNPQFYTVSEGKILSPAAREYLQQCKIKIAGESFKRTGKTAVKPSENEIAAAPKRTETVLPEANTGRPEYVDYETGAYYYNKPEHMTHLYGNVLVFKDHQRICFRGKLDSLQALFILNQTILEELGGCEKLIVDLGDLVAGMREMMRCDVLDEPLKRNTMIGLTHDELREHSHHPMKYYQVKQMVLPDKSLGKAYALLNQLRTQVRETEVAAVAAFRNGKTYERNDIIEELNRMSSALHIIMCKFLAGDYQGKEGR